MKVELFYFSVVERTHFIGTGIQDPYDTCLFVSSQSIGIDAKVFDFTREAGHVAHRQGVESCTISVEGSDDVVQLAVDGVDTSLEAALSWLMDCGNDFEVQSPCPLSEKSDVLTVWSTRRVVRVILLDTNAEGVLRPVGVLKLLGDLFVCKEESACIGEKSCAPGRNFADIVETESRGHHQVALERVQTVSTSVATIGLIFESRELVILRLLRGREPSNDDLCIDLQ